MRVKKRSFIATKTSFQKTRASFFVLSALILLPTLGFPEDNVEELRRQALDSFHLGQFEQSKELCLQLMKTDPMGVGGQFAGEQLQKILIQQGSVQDALQNFVRLKNQGQIQPLELLSEAKKFAYDKWVSGGQFQSLLTDAFKKGGWGAAQGYLVSWILRQQGAEDASQYVFKQSVDLIENVEKERYQKFRHQMLKRPLELKTPGFYEALRIPPRSEAEFQTVAFPESADLDPERWTDLDGAFRKRLDQDHWVLDLGLFPQFEDHPLDFSNDPILYPSGLIERNAVSMGMLVGAGYQSDPVKNWKWGMDYQLYWHRYTVAGLGKVDELAHLPALRLTGWNRRNSEILFRYDYAYAFRNRDSFEPMIEAHGPSLIFTYAIRALYRFTFQYGFSSRRYPHDSAGDFNRGGTDHQIDLQWDYQKQNRALEPFFAYVWDRDQASGKNWNRIRHLLSAGTVYRLRNQALMRATTGIQFDLFPLDRLRSDQEKLARVEWSKPLSAHFNLLARLQFDWHDSTAIGMTYRETSFLAGFTTETTF